MTDKKNIVRRFFSAGWAALTWARLALSNIVFVLVLLALFIVLRGEAPELQPARAALLLNPAGTIVEEKSYTDALSLLWSEPLPAEREVLLRDVIDAINYAAEDAAITALVLQLDQLAYVGISKTEEIAIALARFRDSGKPIVALADYYTQDQYLLAVQADTILVHPYGGVAVEGYSSYRNYLRDALDKASLNVHVFRAGEYKSAGETFVKTGMGEEEKRLTRRWLMQLWGRYTDSVEQRRKLEPGALNGMIENLAPELAQHGGDLAAWALDQGLVDQLLTRHASNAYLVDIVGASNGGGVFEAVQFERYVSQQEPLLQELGEHRIAVLTASGTIANGQQPAGTVGGDSLAALIAEAVEDEFVDALVLRVDSPGGSAFASEIIRQEILRAKAANKPVVVSMSSMAASGGYWISANADQIWAMPSTLTGSIGVFAAFPTVEDLLQRLGIYTDGVGTTPLAGSLRIDRSLSPVVAQMVQGSVNDMYRRFIELVATGRQLSVEDTRAVAEGIVWSGAAAQEVGLVDHLGGLDDAIAAAAELAGLQEYDVEYYQLALSPRELLMRQFLGLVKMTTLSADSRIAASVLRWVAPLGDSLAIFAQMDDPRSLYAHCADCIAP